METKEVLANDEITLENIDELDIDEGIKSIAKKSLTRGGKGLLSFAKQVGDYDQHLK